MISGQQWEYLSNCQIKLDNYIFQAVKVQADETLIKRKLAFLVELAEFINEQRDFKYWSRKAPADKETQLEEYIDGIHFLVSIGNTIGFNFAAFKYQTNEHLLSKTLTEIYLTVFEKFTVFCCSNDVLDFEKFLISFLTIAEKLSFTENEIIVVYNKKNAINFDRQVQGY